MYGITTCALIPMRAEPSHRAEMTSQLLLGELFTILGTRHDWVHVAGLADGYQGWIPTSMAHLLSPTVWQHYTHAACTVCPVFTYAQHTDTGARLVVPQGARLYDYQPQARTFVLPSQGVYQLEAVLPPPAPTVGQQVVQAAMCLLSAPYLWGGRTLLGIDCSGLSQLCYRIAGVQLPRDAYQQVDCGTGVEFVDKAQPADLAFFDNQEGRITHVGLCLGQGRIIHASGQVRIDTLDNEGIYHPPLQQYTHHLRVVRRIQA